MGSRRVAPDPEPEPNVEEDDEEEGGEEEQVEEEAAEAEEGVSDDQRPEKKGKWKVERVHEASDEPEGEPESERRSARALPFRSPQLPTGPVSQHLDPHVWQIIRNWAISSREGIGFFADHQEVFEVEDFLFLLEAARWVEEGNRPLSRACIRLYLLAGDFKGLHEAEHKSFLNNIYQQDRQYSQSGVTQRVTEEVRSMVQSHSKRLLGADEGLAPSQLSVSQMTLPRVPPHNRRQSHASSRNSWEEGADFQSELQRTRSSLHQSFRTENYKWFTVGRVFTMLWHENATGTGSGSGGTSIGLHGEEIFSHIRRFAVVKQFHCFCWAIPVNTYKQKGVARKKFVKSDLEAHAILYMEGTKPDRLPNEPYMPKKPIAVKMSREDRKLHPASRIRFDKVFTIEGNVKVQDVGVISWKSMPFFTEYWRKEALDAAGGHPSVPGPSR